MAETTSASGARKGSVINALASSVFGTPPTPPYKAAASMRAGNAGADQSLVADELEGKADQDRREDREPRPLCRLPDGRGRHSTANVPGDFAAHRGAATTATNSASMRRPRVMRSTATDGRGAPECQGKWPDKTLKRHSDA